MIWRQTAAIFLDAYRELNARKLFWLALILSGVVVLAFAAIGFRDGNLTILVWKTPFALEAMGISAETFFKFAFVNFGVKFWLAWCATIIGIVTTAGVIPDFISGGAIDLALSKPIGRVRLFLTKYVSGLLFVALQVAVFSVLSFFVLGLRAGAWIPGVFLAIPLMILFFSYLYCVSALVGLLTRSTIAAMIAALLFWFFVFLLNTTDSTLISFKAMSDESYNRAAQRVEMLEQRRDDRAAQQEGGGVRGALIGAVTGGLDEERINAAVESRDAAREDLETIERWHNRLIAVKTLAPKTNETLDLLQRALIEMTEMERFVDSSDDSQPRSTVRVEPGGEEDEIRECEGMHDPEANRIAPSSVSSDRDLSRGSSAPPSPSRASCSSSAAVSSPAATSD